MISYSGNLHVEHSVHIISCSGVDKRIMIWEMGKAQKLCELKGHTDTVYQLVFSRDGNILASGTYIQYMCIAH